MSKPPAKRRKQDWEWFQVFGKYIHIVPNCESENNVGKSLKKRGSESETKYRRVADGWVKKRGDELVTCTGQGGVRKKEDREGGEWKNSEGGEKKDRAAWGGRGPSLKAMTPQQREQGILDGFFKSASLQVKAKPPPPLVSELDSFAQRPVVDGSEEKSAEGRSLHVSDFH